MTCTPGSGIDGAGASLFASERMLDDYIDAYADGYAGVTGKGCGQSTYSYTSWGPGRDLRCRGPCSTLCRPGAGDAQ